MALPSSCWRCQTQLTRKSFLNHNSVSQHFHSVYTHQGLALLCYVQPFRQGPGIWTANPLIINSCLSVSSTIIKKKNNQKVVLLKKFEKELLIWLVLTLAPGAFFNVLMQKYIWKLPSFVVVSQSGCMRSCDQFTSNEDPATWLDEGGTSDQRENNTKSSLDRQGNIKTQLIKEILHFTTYYCHWKKSTVYSDL